MGADLSFPQVEISPDRTYLVTGGNTGIGYCAAKEIAQMGGHVIIACRNIGKAETAVKQMKEENEKEFREKRKDLLDTNQEPRKLNLDIMELDLASFDKTMKFIEEFKARNCSLHGLLCNAGIFMQEKVMTDDGYETMLQSNYLSHLLIILHFLPILQKSEEDARIVQTSSGAYEMGKFDERNINADKSFSAFGLYSNSKLYQIMSMYWLTRHVKDKFVTISSCHPGFVKTQMTESYWLMRMFIKVASRNPKDGASTIIKAAIDPSLKAQTGLYLADCKIKATSSYAMNVENQDKLMAYSFQVLENYLPQDIKEYIDM